MATIRVAKNQNYSVINNTVLNDDRLSWKAKGLAAYLLSKPDDWSIVREDLAKRSRDGVDAVRTALKELEDAGYLVRTRRSIRGKFEWEHILHEIPLAQAETPLVDFPPVEKPSVEKPSVEKPSVENPRLLSTVLPSTDLLSTDEEEATGIRPLATEPPAPSAPPALPSVDTQNLAYLPPEPKPAPKVPKAAVDTQSLAYLPPIKAYHDLHKRWPQHAQMCLISESVTDLALWIRVLREWAGRGYSPVNVSGMLDWYRSPALMERTKQGDTHGAHKQAKRADRPAGQTAAERASELFPEYAYLGGGGNGGGV
ncbi:MAG: helix-turn-helix domain-containing protein [Caldilineaceae bacterium]|nr:helix-turn-helix domain-containing protein [Caldilineaceae bacterium]